MNSDPFTDRKYIRRRETATERAWQFQFEMEPFKESKYFTDNKYGSKEESFAAAKRYRDDFLASAAELGFLAEDGTPARSALPILLKLSARNTSGIAGVCRICSHHKGKKNPEVVWAANYKTEEGEHTQKKFHVRSMGEKAALIEAVRFRKDYVAAIARRTNDAHTRPLIEKHLEDLEFLIEYIESLTDETELYVFLSTLNNPEISATEKQGLIDLRIGQARFRKLVLAIWGEACCITGSTVFLTAAHIKPWAKADDAERLDPFNGLALSPTFDKAFDIGFISFENDGRIVISPRLGQNATRLGIRGDERIMGLDSRHIEYLEYHRDHVYQAE